MVGGRSAARLLIRAVLSPCPSMPSCQAHDYILFQYPTSPMDRPMRDISLACDHMYVNVRVRACHLIDDITAIVCVHTNTQTRAREQEQT